MTNKEHRPAAGRNSVHFSKTLLLKVRVAYCQYLVYDQDFTVEVGRNGETQSNRHAAAVAFDGVSRYFAQPLNSTISSSCRVILVTTHPENRAVHVDVLATVIPDETPCRLPGDWQSGFGLDASRRGCCDSGKEFQECALPCPVPTNDAQDFALLDFEVDVAKSPEVVRSGAPERRDARG